MQFLILLIGALVFTFYQFNKHPVFFNEVELRKVAASPYDDSLKRLQQQYTVISDRRQAEVNNFTDAINDKNLGQQTEAGIALKQLDQQADSVRNKVKALIASPEVGGDNNDTNYIFLRFVVDYLPHGLVGLLIAIIFLAAWGSIAAALNSLASCTIVDFHKRFSKVSLSSEREYRLSKIYTVVWGVFCIIVAQFAYNIGNSLIEAVNVLGSLFYGVILGIFLTAFYAKRVSGGAVFTSAVIVQSYIAISFFWPWLMERFPVLTELPVALNDFMLAAAVIGFLWLNVIGAIGVVLLALLIQALRRRN
jgi:uncharacterized sodium:solute symporter family permease YidK